MSDNNIQLTHVTPAGTGPHYIGFCHECQSTKTFNSERARDLWQQYHPHNQENDQ